MHEVLELRVLTGLHRDARCPARHDAVLGTDPDCDIVLADEGLAPRTVRLKLGTNGWDLAPDSETAEAPVPPSTPFNQALPLGPIWITVARPSDPWHSAPDAANDHIIPPPADSPTDEPPTDAPPAPQGIPRARGRNAPELAPPGRRKRHWSTALGMVIAVATVALAILLAWLLPGTPATNADRPDPRAAAEQSLGQIQAAIDHLGLGSRLHVAITPDHIVQVSGWVRDVGERDSLSAALAQIWPMPAMQVSSEAEAVQIASAALRNLQVKYEARYEGNGRLSIQGVAPDDPGRVAALDAVRAQLPGMTVLGNHILLAPSVADALAQALADAHLNGVTLVWQDHRLQAGTKGLTAEQMVTLDVVLAQFNQDHFNIASLADGDHPYADTVPFRIRSVVSGKTPFIVLEDGSKLLIGGSYRHYRLTAIEDSRLLFDGPRPAIILR